MMISSGKFFPFYIRELFQELLDIKISSANSDFKTCIQKFNEDFLSSESVNAFIFSNESNF